MTTSRTQQIQQLEQEWKSLRWEGIIRARIVLKK
ncbi:isocitrate lyase [Yersinia enterocolitica]|nr:isocitrate lyase [Yersinia enterocolitica]